VVSAARVSLSRGQAVLAGEPVADRPLVNVRASTSLASSRARPSSTSRVIASRSSPCSPARADLLAPCVRLDVCRGRLRLRLRLWCEAEGWSVSAAMHGLG